VSRRVRRTVLGGAALAVMAVMAGPGYASAAPGDITGSETVAPGTLSYSSPSAVGFPLTTLNGTDKVAATGQAFDVSDLTGSGAGWSITLTSTTFTSGAFSLAATATTDVGATAPAPACDASVTCTLGDDSSVHYPIAVPADTVAPAAVKIQSAALNTGLGGQTWTHTMNLAIPSNTRALTYTSTWTYTLASAP
jgi:hypothetical protein